MYKDIITKKVNLHWKNNMKKHYVDKGYSYNGDNQIFEVDINHLSQNSQIPVKCKCQHCDEIIDIAFTAAIKKEKIICWKCRYKDSFEFYDKYITKIKNIVGDQKVKVVWNGINKSWYEYKGYKYTKQNDILGILAYDLPIGSDIKVKVKCNYCNEFYNIRYNKLTSNIINNCKICCPNCTKQKIENTNMIKYGYKTPLMIPEKRNEIIKKILQTKYKNGTNITSKPQIHIHKLVGGEHCYPVDKLQLDIAFPENMIYIEYDGSGHDARVGYGCSREQFNRREFKRKKYLENKGWKLIRIKCKHDKLPLDSKMIFLINISKKYLLTTNHTWIEIDLNKMELICNKYIKKIPYGYYYDGRKIDKVHELADVALLKGLIPRYAADGTPSESGRTFKISVDDEELIAKKRDEVYPELKKYPKIQSYLLELLKNPENMEIEQTPEDADDNMTEEEFQNSLEDDSIEGAEEVETGWDSI